VIRTFKAATTRRTSLKSIGALPRRDKVRLAIHMLVVPQLLDLFLNSLARDERQLSGAAH
jgi:hypothetical protein